MKKNLLLLMFLTFLAAFQNLSAQESKISVAIDYMLESGKSMGMTSEDIKNLKVNYEYQTDHNKLTHLYLIQTYKDIELHNGIINFNIMPNDEVLYVGNNGIVDLKSKINTIVASISPSDAVAKAIQYLKIDSKIAPKLLNKISDREFLFDKGDVSYEDVKVKLKYQPLQNGKVRLAWDIEIDQVNGINYWSMRIDAVNGELLEKTSYTAHDQFVDNPYSRISTGECDEVPAIVEQPKKDNVYNAVNAAGEAYSIFAWPIESPIHGSQTLVTNPSDAVASPFGWHDTNGAAGAEYQITRGNNVWAYANWDGTNVSKGDEPNGGAALLFDFPYNAAQEPDLQVKAATVNLFYNNNMMHDFAFRYGFNEKAGNFQAKNYSNIGSGNDYVRAQAQDSSKVVTPPLNNANFATPPDGGAPRMRMYLWNNTGNRAVNVTSPADIEGNYENGTAAVGYGPAISTTPISGKLEIAEDNTQNPTWACSTLKNTTMAGKIALIDRGTCQFSEKTYNAQLKGAIAVIICNFENTVINMAAGLNAAKCTIPSVFMKSSDCNKIRAFIKSGVDVTIVNKVNTGPVYLDGDYDNGIINHEYGHGISNRLTGGPLTTTCLNNEEQMGEGWSDFMSLITTAKAGDTKNTKRAVGNYAEKKGVDGAGIRTYPYSYDMSINPLTYDRTIQNPEIHATGEIWCQTIWDMYWAFSDLYGWSADLKDTSSGNGKAIKLVFDGMKIQKCSPGFLDGRDAILAADKADFGGLNNCMIWNVFARRGQGYNASQGSSVSATDGKEDFTPNPYCSLTLKVEKEVTELLKQGDDINVTIRVMNHKKVALTNVNVEDEIPVGATFKAGSASLPPNLTAGKVSFVIPTMKPLDSVLITYKLAVNKKPVTSFYDGAEDDSNWSINPLKGKNIFGLSDLYKNSGTYSFEVAYPPQVNALTITDQVLELSSPINIKGTKPTLGFYHYYETEPGSDGGIVQYTTDNLIWNDFGPKMIKNGYRGPVTYSTFAIPNQNAFWGTSNTVKGKFAPTFIDLTDLKGKDVKFRFRFGTDSLITALGWYIDDILIFDMVNYSSTVRAFTVGIDTAYATPKEKGSIVIPDFKVTTNTFDPKDGMKVNVFPNPTNDFINIEIQGSTSNNAEISVFSIDGKLVNFQKHGISNGFALIPIDMSKYNEGMYFVKVQTELGVVVEKIVKQ
jgi:extracellular elastinolytic metalloproteinase